MVSYNKMSDEEIRKYREKSIAEAKKNEEDWHKHHKLDESYYSCYSNRNIYDTHSEVIL